METKQEGVCANCGNPLRVSTSNRNRGQFARCSKCYSKKYSKDWYERNRKRILAEGKEKYRKNAASERKRSSDRWYALSEKERKRRSRIQALRRKYGITVEDYDRMFVEQKGKCFLCGKRPKKGRPLSVDHCKDTKKVRKLLCDICNRSLGHIERDLSWVERALRYLEKEIWNANIFSGASRGFP